MESSAHTQLFCPKQSCPEGSQLLLSAPKIPFSCPSSITPAKCSPQKYTLQQGCASASRSSHSSSTANIPCWSPRKGESTPTLMSGLSQQTAGMWLPHLGSCRTDEERGEEGQKLGPKVLAVSLWACRGSHRLPLASPVRAGIFCLFQEICPPAATQPRVIYIKSLFQ